MKVLEETERTKGHNWKGDDAKYCAKHQWIARNFGKASKCEHCNTTEPKKFEWANISGTYQRDRSDYMEMCPSCHRKMDFARSGKCRKGHEMTPENTYMRKDGGRACRICGREADKRYELKRKQRGNVTEKFNEDHLW